MPKCSLSFAYLGSERSAANDRLARRTIDYQTVFPERMSSAYRVDRAGLSSLGMPQDGFRFWSANLQYLLGLIADHLRMCYRAARTMFSDHA